MNYKSKVDFSMIKNNDFLICLYNIYYTLYISLLIYKHITKSLFLIIKESNLLFEFIIHIYWNTEL